MNLAHACRRAAIALACVSTVAHAQRFRVIVGMAGSTNVSVVEFRPCVPAEGSGCGAWLERVVDTAIDSSYGQRPTIVRQAVVSGGAASVAIANGRVTVTPQSGPSSGRAIIVKGIHGTPTALLAAADGDDESVFVVSEGAAAGESPEVCLIDVRFNEVVARLRLDAAPAGVAMARR